VKTLCKSGILLEKGKIVLRDGIDQCISKYQNTMYDAKSFEDLSHYDNEFFDLLDYRLVNEAGENLVQPMGNNEKAFVRIELNMKKTHYALKIGYAIYNSEGMLMYWSYQTDQNDKDNNVVPGRNVLTGEIPNYFLNEGEYYIYLSSSLHFIQWLVDPEKDAPCLKLHIQGGLSNSPLWMIKRPGVCAPLLKWSVKTKT
jgi:lipopolysaccharide transport system ATP-binding protein